MPYDRVSHQRIIRTEASCGVCTVSVTILNTGIIRGHAPTFKTVNLLIPVNLQAGLCSQESCGRLEVASYHPRPPDEPNPDKLSIALEPESAAIFCQNMSRMQTAAYCTATPPFTAGSYLVVDIGGGTVDISALRVSSRSDGNIEAIHSPTGSDFGGSRVNKEFETFLENTVNDPGFSKYH